MAPSEPRDEGGAHVRTWDFAALLASLSMLGPFAIDMTSSSEGIPIPPLAAQLGSTPVRTDDADPRPPLATALKEQLGLALEMRREPVRRLVIEHVEAPSPN